MKNINIREALLELDKRTGCQYDLTTLYEACKLDDNDKNQLVKYIDAYDHPSVIGGFLASKCEALSEELGDDDVSDLKVIDDINCGEDHTLWSLADKLEDDALELKELTEDVTPDEKVAIAGRIREAATGVLVGKLGYEEDFVDNYMTIDVDDTDENTHIKVEVRAEVDYDELMTLGQALDPIVREYDKNAYFEPVTSGIMSAYIRKDQSDDIPDEAAVKEWTDRFNACKTKDDVINLYRDLIKVRDNEEVTFGTIEAIYDVIDAKMSSLGEALNEALFTVPADYEDYCPHCANRALKGVGDGRAICDSCGAEYEVIALGNNRVRLEPLFLSEAVTYPNGVECRDDSVDMDKALDYQYGTDRDPDNSHYTEQEKQKALNYWMDKHDPRSDGKSYMTESTLITPVLNGYHNLWKISDNLLVHDDGGAYHVVQKDGWKNTYIFNTADIEEVNDFLMSHYDVALARANPTEMKDKEETRLTDEEKNELINIVAMSFETGHFSFDDIEDFKRECSHMVNIDAAWNYYHELVNMGPRGFYEEFKDEYDFDDMFVAEYGHSDYDESLTTDNSEWFVGDSESGYMYKGKEAAQKAYDRLVKAGVKDAVMKPAEDNSLAEAFDADKVQKRIARVNEFDNGYVIHNDYFKATSAEAEEMAKQKSIENPDEVFYVKYDNIMEPCSDIKWKNGQQLTETVEDDVQYGVHSFSQDAIIFRGTEEECGKYIDQHKELWDDAEVYRMTPDDPHYKKEEKLTLSESDDTDILYNLEEPDDYDGIEAGHQFIEDGHEWTLFKQCGETVHLDFDNWAVWWAYRPEIDGDENSTAISGFFVIDIDTGFIDWGPCDTVEEAQQFLQSKVNDWELDESYPSGTDPKAIADKILQYHDKSRAQNDADFESYIFDSAKAIVTNHNIEVNPEADLDVILTKLDRSQLFSLLSKIERYNNFDESLKVGDRVKVNTPGNDFYNGRIGRVDYLDKYVNVTFEDEKSPRVNYFDYNQVSKIDESLTEGIEVATIADYITDHYDFDNVDDKYSCINSIKDSHKDTISKEELEQFIGSHNGKDKVTESVNGGITLDEGLFDDDFSDEEIASITGGDTKYDTPDGLETPDETDARLAEINEAIFGTNTHIIKVGDTLTSRSGHKIHIDDMSATLTPFENNAIVTFHYSFEMTDGTTGKSQCTTPDLKNMLQEDVTDVATATLEGPEEGAAAGVASLINDAIQDELKTADEYNSIAITAKAEGHEDVAAVIDEINTEEHKHIGQLEQALKKVAPNAEAIDVGKVEGEQQLGEVTDEVVVKEGIQPNDLAANVEDAFVKDELDLFVADALSDGSATEETLLTIANDSSNIELDDMKKAINAYKESLDTNNSNSTLNNNSNKDVLEESNVTESWEKIYQSFKTIEKELNNDGEAVTAVIDKMYQDNKHDPDYQKAYDKWASGE